MPVAYEPHRRLWLLTGPSTSYAVRLAADDDGVRPVHWGAPIALDQASELADLPTAETVLTSRRGVTSHHANPWLAIDDGTAGEETGEVFSAALAWSGSWRITVHRDPSGRAGFTGGFGHEGLTWTLAPGETLETPAFAGLHTMSGFGGASRSWHFFVRDQILPEAQETRPVLYNSWEATGFDVDEAGQLALAARAAGLGAELFVMDDGWFGARTSERAGLGDWTPNPRVASLAAWPPGRRGPPARHAVRPVARTRDGQAGQRPLSHPPRLGVAHAAPAAYGDAPPAGAQPCAGGGGRRGPDRVDHRRTQGSGRSGRDLDTGATHSGAALLGRGLPLDLPAGDHASVLVRLQRIDITESKS